MQGRKPRKNPYKGEEWYTGNEVEDENTSNMPEMGFFDMDGAMTSVAAVSASATMLAVAGLF